MYVSNPPFAPLLAAAFQRLPYSILVYDLYPDVLVQHGVVDKNSFVATRWARRNQRVFGQADKVFTLSESMRTALRPYFIDNAAFQEKTVIIPNWADTDMVKPISRQSNNFLKNNALEENFIVLYSGNMGITHPLETLLDVAEKLIHQPDIVFVLIGNGAKRADLEKSATERQLSNVRFMPYQPFDQLSHSLSAADLNVIALDKAAATASVPSKTYYALAAGCALLAIGEAHSEVAQLIEQEQIGATYSQDDIDGIAQFILAMKNEHHTLQAMRERSSAAASHYTPLNAQQYPANWPSVK